MMTELSFLIELLLNHDLPKATKDLIATRIREVEEKLLVPPHQWADIPMGRTCNVGMPKGTQQAASTIALMAKHGDMPPVVAAPVMPPVEPVAQIAQTPATAAAMNSRNEAIAQALSGKIDKVSGRPKKW